MEHFTYWVRYAHNVNSNVSTPENSFFFTYDMKGYDIITCDLYEGKNLLVKDWDVLWISQDASVHYVQNENSNTGKIYIYKKMHVKVHYDVYLFK